MIYMGLAAMTEIAAKLMAHGMPGDLPALAVARDLALLPFQKGGVHLGVGLQQGPGQPPPRLRQIHDRRPGGESQRVEFRTQKIRRVCEPGFRSDEPNFDPLRDQGPQQRVATTEVA